MKRRPKGARPIDDGFTALLGLGRPLVVLLAAAAYVPPQGSATDVARALLVAGVLVLAPPALGRRLGRPRIARAATYIALLALAPSAAGWLLAALAGAFALAHSRARLHRWALLTCALPIGMGALLLQLCPSLAALILAPLSTLFSLTSALFLQRRAARAGVRPAALRPVPAWEGARRIAEGWPLGLVIGALTLLLFSRGSRLAESVMSPPEPTTSPRQPLPAPNEPQASDEQAESESAGSGPRRNDGGFDPSIGFGGGVFVYSDEEVLRLRPLGSNPRPSAVYLRGVILDALDVEGAAPQAPGQRYAVDSRRLDLEGGGWSPLFAAEPLAGIELPSVAYDPDRGLFLPEVGEERVRYRFEQAQHDWSRRVLARTPARHPAPRFRQLPDPSALPPELEAFLTAAAPQGPGDLGTVLGIVGYLRTNFTYERLETGFEGLAVLTPFLQERRGFCTHFSTLATLALRARGLPARVATGFVAHEWDIEMGEFIVRDRNAHAWIEVHFEGVGWVAFDPTPAQEGRPEFPGGLTYDEPVQELRDALGSWLAGDPGSSLAGVLDAGARASWAWAIAHAPTVLGVLLLAWLAARWLQGGGRSRNQDQAPESAPPGSQNSSAVRRLLRALERAGHRRRRGQTLLQLARTAVRGDARLRPAEDAALLHYSVRYGGADGDPRRLEALLRALEEASQAAIAERASQSPPP